MATNYNPRIVTDGLVLALDAGNTKSYNAGISTTAWNDLSGNGNNGTLINMDSSNYDSVNGGVFTFDGTNEYIDLFESSSILSVGSYATIECWFKSGETIGSEDFSVLFGWRAPDESPSHFSIGNLGSFSTTESIHLLYGKVDFTAYVEETTSTYHDGNWHHAVATIGPGNHKIYVDGIEKNMLYRNSSNNYSVANIFTFQLMVGRRAQTSGYFNGNISSLKIYDRILAPQEIQQNFNATRSRFGI